MSKINVPDYGDEELAIPGESDSGIKVLSELVSLMARQQVAVERAEQLFKDAKKELANTREVLVPEKFLELGIAGKFTTSSGLVLEVKQKLKAKIPNRHRDQALAWLVREGYGKMIKESFSCDLKDTIGGDNAEMAETIRKALDDSGAEYTNKKDVHFATLAAFVRERDARGEESPKEMFGIHRYAEAKLS